MHKVAGRGELNEPNEETSAELQEFDKHHLPALRGGAFSCSRYMCRPTVFLGVGLECLLVVYGLLEVDFNSNTLRVAVLSDRWVELKLRWYSYLDSP